MDPGVAMESLAGGNRRSVSACRGRYWDSRWMPTDVRSSFTQAAVETAFVVVWVAAAMVATALLAVLPLPGLARMPLAGLAGVVVAATVGLIPGCGAQIAFTGLYLSGVVPLPVLLANAVAQDGDALLPLIALDRRAAVVTCALTTLPALTVGWTALLVL